MNANALANQALQMSLGGGGGATGLVLGVVISTIGVAYMRYGRKQERPASFVAGLAMSIYPWFVYKPWPLFLIGVALAAVPLVF